MNILYLHTHDTGRYIQPYGYPVQTPHLQQFAEHATVFRNAYCTGPTCSPSRAGMLTGVAPHSNGMWGLSHRGFSLWRPEEHLASFLARNGFETVLCGIQHETEQVEELGYTTFLDNQAGFDRHGDRDWGAYDKSNAYKVASYLRQHHDKPFFLSFGMFNTHRPFPALPDDALAHYVQVPPTVQDTDANRHDMARFIESVKIVDACVGTVLAAVQEAGLFEDTVVMFTTDHGIAFPQMKCQLFDSGIGVSLILGYPGNPMAGRVCDALVSHLDVVPTLCELTGIQMLDGRQGRSLVPLLTGESEQVHDEIHAEINFHVAYEPSRCVRTREFKYIRRFGSYPNSRPSNTDDSSSKQQYMDTGFYGRQVPLESLYDLRTDPCERVNLVSDPLYAGVLEDLRHRLALWMTTTKDPLLSGPLVPVPTALVNYPDSLSPADTLFIHDWSTLD